ncbi:MAG TPA: ABC transporter permease [Gemmatimonadaceae bacterium]|nr:ABC transporter permease [Gemmatimonadaceae bacterium]
MTATPATPATPATTRLSWFYRALLRLYPSSFRADYAAELTSTFEAQVRDRGSVAGALIAVGDAIPNAIAAHWEILRQDLRYTMRTLANARGFAVAAVLVTALGVGANTATFSVADFVLVRPLPFKDPDQLVRLCEGPREGGGWGCMNELSPGNYRDVVKGTTAFTGWGAFTGASVNLVGAGEPVRIGAMQVTPEVFPVLGVAPMLGRTFDVGGARDADATSVVLSYGLWQAQFGGDERVIGRTVQLDGSPRTIIGVMPPAFRFPDDGPDLWLPLLFREDDYLNRGNTYVQAIGRLHEGVSFERGRTELASLFDRLARDYPETNAETGFSYLRQRDFVLPRYRLMLLGLCGASLCLLLLTCANLANLLLARAAGRERELAVRAALGAGRDRLVRQMLTESVVLALLGGAAGVAAAALAMPLLSRMVPPTLPRAGAPGLDLRVFAIAAAFSVLTGLGFGLLPALRAGGIRAFGALREGTRGSGSRQRLRTALVALEVAMSVTLLISSGLLIRAVLRVQAVDPGFRTDGVVTLRTELPSPAYDSAAPRAVFYDRVLAGVRALPGVEQAAYTSGLPMVLTGGIAGVAVPGYEVRNRRREGVGIRFVTSQYFGALRVPFVSGRDIEDGDTRDRQLVAVVSESFVDRYWPNARNRADALGKTFEIRGQNRAIVGVVADIKVRGLERTAEPQVYVPAKQPPDGGLGGLYVPKDLVIRAPRQGLALVSSVREIVRQADANQPLSNIRMMGDVVGNQTADRRAQIRVLSALALLALLLAGVGIHGLLAFTVTQRAREIGVRLALGANPGTVARMVVSEAARMALLGVVPGIIGAYAAARAMSALLFGVRPEDPLTFSMTAAICLATAVVGAVRPALRAARVDPISALRAD